MLRLAGAYLGGLMLLSATAQGAFAAADISQAEQDWQELESFVTQFQSQFVSRSDLEKKGQAFVDEWTAWKKRFQEFMKQFRNRYGATAEEVARAFEGVQRPLGVRQEIRPLFQTAAAVDVAAKERTFAQWAATLGRRAYARWENFDPEPTKMELKLDYAERALRYFNLASELDPAGDYQDFIQQAQQAVEETRRQWEETLKELKWPRHNPDFEGPGSPAELAEAALEFLRNHPDWSAPEYDDEHVPVAACVTGKTWEVSKKTVLGEPTQYSLDCFVAFAGKKDPRIAYCYHMVFYTREEPGVAKSPPFHFANSRQYARYKMLMANVPQASGERPPTAGFVGFVLRLALAFSLLLGGLIAAEPAVRGQSAQLSGALDTVVRMRGVVGIVLLALGAICLLRTSLFYFSPLADVLPQAAAIVLGLLLGKEILFSKMAPALEAPAGGQAGEPPDPAAQAAGTSQSQVPAAEKLRQLGGAIESLERFAVPLGLVGLALGLIHLLLGGWILF